METTDSTVFMPYEVGEYSIYVHENLEGILQVGITAEEQNNALYTYWTKEIVASPDGSILYFDEKLKNIEAGHIYRGWKIPDYRANIRSTTESLLQEYLIVGKISLETYLKYASCHTPLIIDTESGK